MKRRSLLKLFALVPFVSSMKASTNVKTDIVTAKDIREFDNDSGNSIAYKLGREHAKRMDEKIMKIFDKEVKEAFSRKSHLTQFKRSV